MRAYVLKKPNNPLQLRDLSPPNPGPSEVRVQTTAVAIHPVDVETSTGKNGMLLPQRRPFVPGVDFVGRVTAVGSAVADLSVGARVFGYRGLADMGAFAEQACVSRDVVAAVPATLTDVEAATLPLPALCTLQALDATAGEGRKRVLVHGGAGGVGSVAVQLLAGLGHEVAATANGRDAAWVQALGAHEVIDYTTTRFEERVQQVDLVLDTVGGDTLSRSFSVVADGGTVASLAAMPTAAALREAGLRVPGPMALLLPVLGWSLRRRSRAAGVVFIPQVTVPSGERLRRAARVVKAHGLSPRIAQTFPFEALNDAITMASQGTARGRVVVTTD
ncbi:MAG: NADP-dependent oxidoreductase [Myxococcota bacterium]